LYIGILALIRESLRQQIVIDLDLQEENRPVLASLLTQGSLTLAGVIRVLSEHGGNLVMVNPELEKIVNHRRDQYLQEHDLIEMLDGTRMGKATSSERTCCENPNVWCFFGSQLHYYLKEFSAESCGRLRLSCTFLDDAQVADTRFAEKLHPRKASETLVRNILKQILVAQHPDTLASWI
jgi:hypothetical protein